MSARFRPAVHLGAILAFGLGLWGWHTSEWSLAAQSESQKWTARAAPAKSEEARAAAAKGQGIAVLVNGEAITAYDIEQRARLMVLGNKEVSDNLQRFEKAESTSARFNALREEVIRTSQGKSREEVLAIWEARQKQLATDLRQEAVNAVLPRLKKEAREELIEERLKLQEAKKFGIELSDDDVKRILKAMADQYKQSPEQFAQNLKGMGVDIAAMGERFRARETWKILIGRRYAPQVSVTQRDVDRLLSSAAMESGEDTVELQLHKVTVALPGKLDQAAWTKRYAEVEALGRRYGGCAGLSELAKNVPDAKFEDMKHVKPSKIAEPIRSMMLGAKDGEMLPPFTTTGVGIEIYAVCGRRTSTGNEEQRTKALAALQSKEVDLLARRLMRNLQQDAVIEDKQK